MFYVLMFYVQVFYVLMFYCSVFYVLCSNVLYSNVLCSSVLCSSDHNPGQNIWHKVKKSGKIEQNIKNSLSNFACFLTAIVTV